jgi:catechol 2,3-dioxygenase
VTHTAERVGYRVPAETRVGKVRLAVSNLERSLAFYEDVIGFRVVERTASRAALGSDGSEKILLELEERPGLRPLASPRLGLYHFAVLLPTRAALGSFAAHLAKLGVRAGSADHLVSEAFYLVDPDGLSVEVYGDRDPREWRFNGSEVMMAVDPLDVAGLIRAANRVVWDGLPSGTTIGHMHFYVGEMEAGRAFYDAGLGLDVMARLGDAAMFLSAGGYHHHVGINTWARGASVAEEGDPRLLEWELVVPAGGDVERVSRSLESRGGVADRSEAKVRFRDPWGIVVSLVAE